MLDVALRRCVRSLRLSLFLALAGKDRIIDNARTRAMLERCLTTDRRVVEYPEGGHTLEFDEDPAPFFADLLAWLEG